MFRKIRNALAKGCWRLSSWLEDAGEWLAYREPETGYTIDPAMIQYRNEFISCFDGAYQAYKPATFLKMADTPARDYNPFASDRAAQLALINTSLDAHIKQAMREQGVGCP